MSRGLKRLEGVAAPSERSLPSLRPPLLEGLAETAAEKKLSLSPLEMALYRLTCTVNARTTPIQDAVISLMKELGADEAMMHLKGGSALETLEHYMTVRKEGGLFSIVSDGTPPGYMSAAAYSDRSMFFSAPCKAKRKNAKSVLYRFNMIPGDAEYSRKDIKNGDRHLCAVPLFMAERGNDGPEISKKLGVLTLKGRSLMVQETRQTGAPAIQKAALLVACGARLLSRIVDARFDPLTALPKKPEFEAQLSRLVADYVAGSPNFSLLMFDLDHFKRVNDTYGHEAGDRALRAVATALSTSLRSIRKGDVQERRSNGHNADMDQCFRWGGEELTVILPKTGISEALIIAERLRSVIESVRVDVGAGEVGISVSAGVSDADTIIGRKDSHDTDIENLAHKLTHEVDFALYAAKDGGRNKVAYSLGTPEGPRKYLLFSEQAGGN